MDKNQLMVAIKELRNYADKRGMDFIIVGSVAQRYDGGLSLDESAAKPDDLDCVFVYSDISQLKHSPFISSETLNFFTKNKKHLNIDLLSVKKILNDTKLSIDFISRSYLNELVEEPYNGQNFFRRKLNDSKETNTNTYCTLNGETYQYVKPCENVSVGNIYTLPTRLYINNLIFPGVLLNKLIYCPILDYIKDTETLTTCERIFSDFFRYVNHICSTNPTYKATNAILNFDNFSDKAKEKIYNAISKGTLT